MPGIADVGHMTMALAMVLAAIFVVAWLVRRYRGSVSNSAGQLQVLAEVRLGAKERAVLLRVGNEQVLLGVSAGSVTALHAAPYGTTSNDGTTAAVPPSEPPSKPSFQSLLMKSLGRS